MSTIQHVREFICDRDYNIVMIEGPRGAGKTTAVEDLLTHTPGSIYYKTWGQNQKNIWNKRAGLNLPQGTYFILDFLIQVPQRGIIVADRGILSALAYQADEIYGQFTPLHEYYVAMMAEAGAAILLLSAEPGEIQRRRILRGSEDEHKFFELSPLKQMAVVAEDIYKYQEGLRRLVELGLHCVKEFEIGSSFLSVYSPR